MRDQARRRHHGVAARGEEVEERGRSSSAVIAAMANTRLPPRRPMARPAVQLRCRRHAAAQLGLALAHRAAALVDRGLHVPRDPATVSATRSPSALGRVAAGRGLHLAGGVPRTSRAGAVPDGQPEDPLRTSRPRLGCRCRRRRRAAAAPPAWCRCRGRAPSPPGWSRSWSTRREAVSIRSPTLSAAVSSAPTRSTSCSASRSACCISSASAMLCVLEVAHRGRAELPQRHDDEPRREEQAAEQTTASRTAPVAASQSPDAHRHLRSCVPLSASLGRRADPGRRSTSAPWPLGR